MLGPLITLLLTAGPTARLDYRVAPGLEGCPDEQWVRFAVSARLGRDPFDAAGENAVSVQLARATGTALVATVEVVRPGGRVGRRTLDSPTGDCLELASAVELAISLALDPSARKPTPPLDAGEPVDAGAPVDGGVLVAEPVVQPRVTEPAAEPPAPPPSSVRTFIVASALVTAGALPGVSGGLVVGGGMKVASFRLSLEGRLHLPTRVLAGRSTTSTFLALGSVVPCLDVGRVSGCLAASVGPFQFDDGFERATTVMAHVGPRVGVRFEPSKLIALVPWVEAGVVLTRTTLLRSGVALWVSWPLSVSGGISLELNPS
ncbi:MAG: hypothetical protein JNJ54_08080 [Myxococcaceae bacterium]|nr:hypothetical protein [Myxococcaceae bacterium]